MSKSKAFTENELMSWKMLGQAYHHFSMLKTSHPSHMKDFCDAIHQAQHILCQMILQREHPEVLATYAESDDCLYQIDPKYANQPGLVPVLNSSKLVLNPLFEREEDA